MMPQFLLLTVLSAPAWTIATVCCVIPLNERNLNKLQRLQNTPARVTCQSPHSSSSFCLWKSLHWLPIRQRVIYKTALITYKTLKTRQLVYLHNLLHYCEPARTLRSSRQLLLYQLVTRINFQFKAFSITITAPAVWSSLSPVTKSSATITSFKAYLKTELFAAAVRMTRSNVSSAAAPPIQTLYIWCHL